MQRTTVAVLKTKRRIRATGNSHPQRSQGRSLRVAQSHNTYLDARTIKVEFNNLTAGNYCLWIDSWHPSCTYSVSCIEDDTLCGCVPVHVVNLKNELQESSEPAVVEILGDEKRGASVMLPILLGCGLAILCLSGLLFSYVRRQWYNKPNSKSPQETDEQYDLGEFLRDLKIIPKRRTLLILSCNVSTKLRTNINWLKGVFQKGFHYEKVLDPSDYLLWGTEINVLTPAVWLSTKMNECDVVLVWCDEAADLFKDQQRDSLEMNELDKMFLLARTGWNTPNDSPNRFLVSFGAIRHPPPFPLPRAYYLMPCYLSDLFVAIHNIRTTRDSRSQMIEYWENLGLNCDVPRLNNL